MPDYESHETDSWEGSRHPFTIPVGEEPVEIDIVERVSEKGRKYEKILEWETSTDRSAFCQAVSDSPFHYWRVGNEHESGQLLGRLFPNSTTYHNGHVPGEEGYLHSISWNDGGDKHRITMHEYGDDIESLPYYLETLTDYSTEEQGRVIETIEEIFDNHFSEQ